jgi:hypothetical protein
VDPNAQTARQTGPSCPLVIGRNTASIRPSCPHSDQIRYRRTNRTGALASPGTVFGDKQNHFRVGFGRTNMPEALARLEEFAERTFPF